MPTLLANAEAADQSFGSLTIILAMCLWIAVIAVAIAVPMIVAWRRDHRHGGIIVVLAVLLGLLSAASALYAVSTQDQWAREEDRLLRSGYYDPAEHQHDPPAKPWPFWTLLAAGYAGLVIWSLLPMTRPPQAAQTDEARTRDPGPA